ncbi:MAG TPA: ABC transporter ATP-binding protein [Armatimonadota bacterium]|jgi:ABC-2 type transport system ATP-binding protein
MSDFAIETDGLTRRFGRRTAVDHLSLTVPRGSVFAFLGRNGAGKTTTIRMLLNLLDKTQGEARVLGLDCARQALAIKRRIGVVADGQEMYDWMTVRESIWFCKGFYPDWDDAFAAEMQAKLELHDTAKVRTLSRGQQAKLALLLAMAYRPELLILDEPTSGLDVVVRRNFLEGVIELVQEEGRTVFFSSHIVHEVERVADWVGILDQGRLIYCAPLEELKRSVRRVVLTFAEPQHEIALPNTLVAEHAGRQVSLVVRDFSDATLAAAQALHPTHLAVDELGLEDIFVAMVGQAEEA